MSPNLLHLTLAGSCTCTLIWDRELSTQAVLFLIFTLPLTMLSGTKQLSVSVCCGQISKWNCPPCVAPNSVSILILDPAVYVATITPLSYLPPWLASRFPAASPHRPQVEYWRFCLTLELERNRSLLDRFYIVYCNTYHQTPWWSHLESTVNNYKWFICVSKWKIKNEKRTKN